MAEAIHIVVDAMGGDSGPAPAYYAARDFTLQHPDVHITLIGDWSEKSLYTPPVPESLPEQITLVLNEKYISSEDRPSAALRKGRDSSMWQSLALVADKKADICVSAGNTGALMAMARYLLGVLPGIDRPAICKAIPTQTGSCYLLDLGANLQCTEEQLAQFALLGAAQAICDDVRAKPRVGLLNVGSEPEKGHAYIRAAAELMRDNAFYEFIGFVEGDTLYDGVADVVVCDGFSGNIALKSSEGVVRFLIHQLHCSIKGSWFKRCVGFLLKPAINHWLKQFEPDKYNGALLLGLDGLLVKCHGASTQEGFCAALSVAYGQVQAEQLTRLRQLCVHL